MSKIKVESNPDPGRTGRIRLAYLDQRGVRISLESTTIPLCERDGLDFRHRRKDKSTNVLPSLRLSPRAKHAV